MIVCTVIGNVQATVAVNEGQVAVAIESANMSRTDSDEVTVITIVNRCRGITINRRGVGVCTDFISTFCRITSCKHGIMNDDTVIVVVGL